MKQANARQVQRHFSELLRWIEQGQEVQITRRNKVVAKLIPHRDPARKICWPDFQQRLDALWGHAGTKGRAASKLILESREERI